MSSPLLSLRGITKRFVQKVDLAGKIANTLGAGLREISRAVYLRRRDLDVAEGEVVGLVGESGCGKSTLGRIVAGILPQTAGVMSWRGEDVAAMAGERRRAWQLAVQMIFQDPYASLNPRLRVSEIVGEAPRVHGLVARAGQAQYVAEMLDQVGLDGAYSTRYPHQFSGGQRQRIGIARALAVQPQFLVCDEAVAALDVSIQAQVLNFLFMELRGRLSGLTYLFISHNRRGGRASLRPGCHHVSSAAWSRSRRADELFGPSQPPLHPGFAGRSAQARCHAAGLQADRGRAALAARSALRLRFPPALPAGHGPLQERAAGPPGGRGPAMAAPGHLNDAPRLAVKPGPRWVAGEGRFALTYRLWWTVGYTCTVREREFLAAKHRLLPATYENAGRRPAPAPTKSAGQAASPG